jgi:hypothetical protein
MPRKKTGDGPASTPSQQDEADIVNEIGATPANDGSNDLLVEEAKIREIGAVDAESVRENRRVEEIVAKKRAGQKDVQFNSDDILEKYEGVIKYWPANTIDIIVKRVTGTPIEWIIQSRPRSGAELYAAILSRHGRCEEAEYDVRLRDCNDKQRRGTGRITMPDTRDTPPQVQGQVPMQQPPPAPSPAPSTDPVAMMQAMFQMFRQMQQPQQAPAPQPVVQTAPSANDPMAQMQAMFNLFQQMQSQVQPQAPQQPVMPPPPPQGSDPAAMMDWMQRAFQLFQKTSQTSQVLPALQPQPQQVAPQSPDPMAMMGRMFDMFLKMQQAAQPPQPQSPPPGPYRGPDGQFTRPYPGQRPPYYGGPPQGYPPPQPPVRPRSAAEELRDAMGLVDTVVSMADRIRPQAAPEPERYQDDDDNPVKVVDVGGWPVIINKEDGSSRKWESLVANMPNMLKWLAEQREAVMKAAAEREAKQQPQRQPLPRGYVEVTPGYKPPPGYVAVPVDQMGGLPAPPDESEMPPPISEQQAPPPQPRRRTWGAPPVPGAGG